MKVVTMTCPGTCGKRYKITISDKDLASSTWTCPNCGYSAPFSVIAQMGHKPDNMPPIANKDKPSSTTMGQAITPRRLHPERNLPQLNGN